MSMAQQSPSPSVNDMVVDGDGSSCSSSPISSSISSSSPSTSTSTSSSTSSSTSVSPTSDPSCPVKTAKVKVAIRVRPLIPKEIQAEEKSKWRTHKRSIIQINARNRNRNAPASTFDAIFGPEQDTKQVYTDVVAPIVEKALQGFNGTVLCYGQTSSGKTHTLYGDDDGIDGCENPGIISLMADELFARIGNDGEREYSLRVGLLEIYNEKLTDLLNRQNPIEDVEVDGVVVPRNLTEIDVVTPGQIMEAVRRVQGERRAEETVMNTKSSRSHTILRVVIETVPRAPMPIMSKPTQDEDSGNGNGNNRLRLNNHAQALALVNSDSPETKTETETEAESTQPQHLTKSVLNFVDLAGSEKLSSTAESSTRLSTESIYIRKSLTSLCRVVNELSKGRYMPVIRSMPMPMPMPGGLQILDVIYKTPTTTSRSLKPIDIDIPSPTNKISSHMSHTASSILKQKATKFKSKPNPRSQIIPTIWRPTIFRKKSKSGQSQRQNQPLSLPVETVTEETKPKSKWKSNPKSGKSSKLRRTSTYTVSASMKNSVPIPGLPLKRHINYRDSKLTRILQSSLEGNAFVTMICNIAPVYVPESRATLRFAKTAKKIKMDPTQNKFLIPCPQHSNGNGNDADAADNESTNVKNKDNTATAYEIQITELVKHLKEKTEKSDEIEKLQTENLELKSCQMFSTMSPSPAPQVGTGTAVQAQSTFKSVATMSQPGHFGDDDDDEVQVKSRSRSRPRTRSETKRSTSTSQMSQSKPQKLRVPYDISPTQLHTTTPNVKIQEKRTPRKISTGPCPSQKPKLNLVKNESVVKYDILAKQLHTSNTMTPKAKIQEKRTPRKIDTAQTQKLLNLMENLSVVRNDTSATQLQTTTTTTPKTKIQAKKRCTSKENASAASGDKRTNNNTETEKVGSNSTKTKTKSKTLKISPKQSSKFLNVRHAEWTALKKEAKYLKQIVADRTRDSLEAKVSASQESLKAKDLLLQNAELSAKFEIANQHHIKEIACLYKKLEKSINSAGAAEKNFIQTIQKSHVELSNLVGKLEEERSIASSQKASHLKEIDSFTMDISKLSKQLKTQEAAFLQKITILNQEISKLTLSLEETIRSAATQSTAHAQELKMMRGDFKLEISKMAKTLREARGSAKLTEMTLNDTIESLKLSSTREISILTKHLEEKEHKIDRILAEYQKLEADAKEELDILKTNLTQEICELSESLKTSQDLNGVFKTHFDILSTCKQEFASASNDGLGKILGDIDKLELLEINPGQNQNQNHSNLTKGSASGFQHYSGHHDHDDGVDGDGGNVHVAVDKRENLLELLVLSSSSTTTTTTTTAATADAMQLLPKDDGRGDSKSSHAVTVVVPVPVPTPTIPDENSVLRKANFWDNQIPKKIKIKFRNQQ